VSKNWKAFKRKKVFGTGKKKEDRGKQMRSFMAKQGLNEKGDDRAGKKKASDAERKEGQTKKPHKG